MGTDIEKAGRHAGLTGRSSSRRAFLKGVGTLTAATGLLALVDACTPSPTATASSTPRRGGTLVEGGILDIGTFNPLLSSGGITTVIDRYLFESLVDINPNNELVAALAEALPTSADSKTFSFKLRKDLKWSDGQPLTSEDVAFTYALLTDPTYKDFPAVFRGQAEATIQSVQTPDPLTIVITNKAVNASFVSTLGVIPILPKHVLGTLTAKQLASADFNTAPSVTSGVFKLVKWDKGQEVRLARNDSYYGGPSLLDTYVYRVLADQDKVATSLGLGEVDMGQVSATAVASLADNKNVQLIRYPALGYWFYSTLLDPTLPAGKLFGDKAVRQAMRWAISVEQIVKAVFLGQAEVMSTNFPSWNWAHDPAPTIKYSYDPEKAKAMLDAAGWRQGASGVREKNGQPLRFNISAASGNRAAESISQILQDQWKAVGMDPQITLKNGTQLVADVIGKRDFDVWVATVGSRQDPDFASVLYQSSGAKPGGVNVANYRNARLDQLFDDARATTDQAKRKDMYKEIQSILLDDLPLAPLALEVSTMGIQKRVNGVTYTPFGDAGHRPWTKGVWVSDGR